MNWNGKIVFIFFIGLFCATKAMANDYDFVKNFELISAEVAGPEVIIKISHPKSFERASFYFAPYQACKESFPPQCEGTVLRLDQGEPIGENTFSRLIIRPDKMFPYGSPIVLKIKGPNKALVIRY